MPTTAGGPDWTDRLSQSVPRASLRCNQTGSLISPKHKLT